jgi:hypothetical protein
MKTDKVAGYEASESQAPIRPYCEAAEKKDQNNR